jgi:hypothetical protein
MPGTIGNTNAVRHGQRSARHGLVHAKLGRRFAAAYGHAGKLRREIERLLVERHGSLSLVEQARIQSVLRLEEGARALERAIAENPKMEAAELRQQRFAIQQFSLQRDRLLSVLLDGDGKAADPSDPLAAILEAARNGQRLPTTEKDLLVESGPDAAESPPGGQA